MLGPEALADRQLRLRSHLVDVIYAFELIKLYATKSLFWGYDYKELWAYELWHEMEKYEIIMKHISQRILSPQPIYFSSSH